MDNEYLRPVAVARRRLPAAETRDRGSLRNLLAAGCAFFCGQRLIHHGQQLQNDRCRVYGMMPRAKIVRRRSCPAREQVYEARRLPLFCSTELLRVCPHSHPAWECVRRRYTARRAQREQNALAQVRDTKNVRQFLQHRLQHLELTAGLGDFLLGRLEDLRACTVSALVDSPSPSTFTGCLLLITPALRNMGVRWSRPAPPAFSRFTMLNSWRKMLVNPRRHAAVQRHLAAFEAGASCANRCASAGPFAAGGSLASDPMPRPTRFLFAVAFLVRRSSKGS